MANSIDELIAVLSGKETLMRELIRLLEEEQRGIVDIDLAKMETTDDRKRVLLVQLEDSNNHFRQILRRAETEYKLPEGANLSCLLPNVAYPQRSTLQGLQARLLELGRALDRIMVFNQELLQGSLKMVNNSLDFFQGLFRRSTTYGYAGSMVTAPTDVRLVCKEI